MRLVARVELVAKVLDVTLDGTRSNAELLRALLRRESPCDALENLSFSLRQADEVVLLARKIHHLFPWSGNMSALSIPLVFTGLQTTERAVPDLDINILYFRQPLRIRSLTSF